jgi:hypothetical protein
VRAFHLIPSVLLQAVKLWQSNPAREKYYKMAGMSIIVSSQERKGALWLNSKKKKSLLACGLN